ncbi:hypothetical protein BKP45_12840 [Anaerobacillus alkalidiazotrophicus]|uniref:Sporulation protein n=2 Tax=Anaerobacillus alkalidiazotrophicus TaxID=472963 RepID=A0A1S2M605_9BACI|nr:DUF1360 domain-containing protein [Anaerobacillus alkalidiazotrophicus]OIJ18451.1 hypothetical protein BKP45_18555 [Anaerobacillus alkalidiazotrophicus]OIJ19930.1 hypothetical protein BKP45_12840 [Anaerobacillus alkalidiazotrophicus]
MVIELNWMLFVMIILASYRFTHLIVFDKVTEFIRKPFLKEKTINEDGHKKTKKVPDSKLGYLLNCYWCTGIWSAIIFGLGYLLYPSIFVPAIFIFAIAGGQTILETFVGVGTKAIQALNKHTH